MNIGIYGGTFNPIHNGHVHLVQAFSKALALDKVLLIPTFSPPHKQPGALAGAQQRLEMCALAAQTIAGVSVQVSDIEIHRAGKSYTADTVRELRAQYPLDRLYLLMGEDMFLTLQDWWQPEVLFQNCVVCAAPRSHTHAEKLQLHAQWLMERYGAQVALVQIPYLPLSSTDIRKKLREGGDVSALVPPGVAAYIRENKLYQDREET